MTLDQALSDLKYGGPELRARATRTLGELKDFAAIPYLIESLSDPEGEVRASAAQALIEFRDQRAVTMLVTLLSDRYYPVREAAAISLGLIGDPVAFKPLLKQAEYGLKNSPDTEARHKATVQAVIALGRLKLEKATAFLGKAVRKGYNHAPSDWQIQLRQAAALALGYMDNSAAVIALLDVLRDSEPVAVRETATTALGMMRNEQGFRLLLEGLKLRPFEDSLDVWRRQEGIITALGERVDRRVVPYILPLENSQYPEVRIALARTLVKLGEDRQTGPLFQLLKDRLPEVRAAAAKALGDLNVTGAETALNVVLKDPNRLVAGAAAIALEAIKQLPPGSIAAKENLLPPGNSSAGESY